MKQLMHSFEGLTPPAEILAAVKAGQIASFCLFAYQNVRDPAQMRALTDALREAAQAGGQLPPLIGIDQEGGQLMAISKGVTQLPGNMALGATRSPELAEAAGRVLGRELLAMGINLNFAPSVDVNSNPLNPVIGLRAFGDEPALVAELGVALIKGMQAEGVMATAKHFPGHGDIQSDTHHDTVRVEHDLAHIEAVELPPFRAAIAAGVEAILTAHILTPILDPDQPATLSAKILGDLLRGKLGFEGLCITDALDMQAVAQFGALESVSRALKAGVDLALLGNLPNQFDIMQALAGTENAVSLGRIAAAQARLPKTLPSLDVVNSAEHQAIAQRIAEAAITQVRADATLPLRPNPDQKILLIAPIPTDLTPADTSSEVDLQLGPLIQARHSRTEVINLPMNADLNSISGVLAAAQDADYVIFGSFDAIHDQSQADLIAALYQIKPHLIVLGLRTPYDLAAFPMVKNYLCTYGIREANIAALVKVLFGDIPAQGVLPCQLPDQMPMG